MSERRVPASRRRRRRRGAAARQAVELSGALLLAHAEARQAAARRPVRARQFRRQSDPPRPGGESALRHAHTKQDEFVYILEGRPTLVTDAGRTRLAPGMCAGFQGRDGRRAPSRQRDATRTSSISRSATVRPATARPTRTTTSPRPWSTGSGASPTRTGRPTADCRAPIAPGSRYRRRGPWPRSRPSCMSGIFGCGSIRNRAILSARSRASWRSRRRPARCRRRASGRARRCGRRRTSASPVARRGPRRRRRPRPPSAADRTKASRANPCARAAGEIGSCDERLVMACGSLPSARIRPAESAERQAISRPPARDQAAKRRAPKAKRAARGPPFRSPEPKGLSRNSTCRTRPDAASSRSDRRRPS